MTKKRLLDQFLKGMCPHLSYDGKEITINGRGIHYTGSMTCNRTGEACKHQVEGNPLVRISYKDAETCSKR